MGRGRTTTGMVTACLISTTMNWKAQQEALDKDDAETEIYDSMDGPSEEEAYLQGKGGSINWKGTYPDRVMALMCRGVQDYPSTRWSPVPWESRQTSD